MKNCSLKHIQCMASVSFSILVFMPDCQECHNAWMHVHTPPYSNTPSEHQTLNAPVKSVLFIILKSTSWNQHQRWSNITSVVRFVACCQLVIGQMISCACSRQKESDPHPSLETVSLSQRERVGFGDHRNDVDFAMDGLHKLNIQRLQAGKKQAHRNTNHISLGSLKC